jgi:two-component system chemotaxis response regulator CheY
MPDVILVDWILAGTTVQEFLAVLNSIPAAKRPFVIYCTTENDSADITRAFAAGADAYVMKPFDRESLVGKFVSLGLAA